MKYGVSKVKIPGEVLAANCLEQTRGTSAKSADQLPPPIAWNRHEQLLATKRIITSPPIAWNRHEVWRLQVLRSKTYLGYKVPEENYTHSYFKVVEAQFWQLKHYLGFCLNSDELIIPWSTVYDDWQKSLNLIAKNCIKKAPGCITVFCKDLLEIYETFEGSIIKQSCEDLYGEFYQRNLNKQISERIRLLDSTIFSERKFSNSYETIRAKNETTKNLRRLVKKEFAIKNIIWITYCLNRVVCTYSKLSLTTYKFKDHKDKKVCEYDEKSPAFFGIFDLSGKDTEVKKLFTDDKWSEMKDDFNKIVEFKDIKPEGTNNSSGGNNNTTSNETKQRSQEEMLYNLFDKIEEAFFIMYMPLTGSQELILNYIENIRNNLTVKASRLYRKARTSVIFKLYADCEQRVRRIHILKEMYKD
ncbi:hypothetical protein C1646_671405 [Rhizophagus diaphanus]|nr:hypothetical protein C1646_671405 [Rhizophagus diaphanus] [Rhizophagus sp. MUCL 43196]